MDERSRFSVCKWYADLIDDNTGDVTIVYLGELRWRFVKVSFTNILQFIDRHRLISRSSFSRHEPPRFDGSSFRVDTLGLHGQWQSNSPCITETLFSNEHGYILWECIMPSASGRLDFDARLHQGSGYIERLTMTLKPWLIPIDILQWGRFLSSSNSIAWIRWEGEQERCFVFHNGRKHIDGIISPDLIRFGSFRLMLSEKHTLRQGPLSSTVFQNFSWMKKLCLSASLNMDECKWQTWSELYHHDDRIAHGWSIHEYVLCKPARSRWGKLCYGSLFTIILPLVLIFWARATENYILIPVPESAIAGFVLTLVGFILMVSAMLELWFKGDGLPMNAYPPTNLVVTGAYRIVSHPIYVGASFVSVGLSMLVQSKSGFWFVSPLLTLSWLALVHGFENADLRKRFPQGTWEPLLSIPKDLKERARWRDYLAVYVLVLIPWLLFYQIVIFIGPSEHALSTYFPFEHQIPVIEWTEFFYLLAYPYVALLPLLLPTQQQVRSYMLTSWMNIGIGIYLQLVLPLIAAPKEFLSTTLLGTLIHLERRLDGPNGAWPSFHVSWAYVSAYYYAWCFPRARNFVYIVSTLISISCMTTGMHSVLDVLAGFALFLLCVGRVRIWLALRSGFEKLANSWSAYRRGRLRIINHSAYAFLSSSMGFYMLCSLVGSVYPVLVVTVLSLIFAGACGQWIERSSGLSRPYGYFGCIAGGLVGTVIASLLFQLSAMAILAAFALASPWIQAVGRLRCVVQGCCHGRPTTSPSIGIVVVHPRSRVCSMSNLGQVPIHLTTGYSMLANILTGLLLWRLWYSSFSLHLIISLYFILIGLGRFVEEAYRGEKQTPIHHKLTIYQWMSILFVCIGMLISVSPMEDSIRLHFRPGHAYIVPSMLFGLLVAFAMGMDFPDSTMRFSRLADL